MNNLYDCFLMPRARPICRLAILFLWVGILASSAAAPSTATLEGAAGEVSTTNFRLQEDLIQASEVVVLGSRSTELTVLESAVPVDVLTPAEIRETGLVETAQVMQRLVPSFEFNVLPPLARGVIPYWDGDANAIAYRPDESWADFYNSDQLSGSVTDYDRWFFGNFPYVGQFNSSIGTRGAYYYVRLNYTLR